MEQTQMHSLKIQRQYYSDLARGAKNFEIRYDDRNYQVNDILALFEHEGDIAIGDSEPLYYKVTYVQEWGCASGYVALGLIPWKYKEAS